MEVFSAAVSVDVKLAKKELQILELRKKLKEHFREELKKESGSIRSSSEEKKKLPYDNYGSFFGQSQPSIARRVIMESEGMLQVQQSTLRLMNSTASKGKPDLLVRRMEADKIKALRDYSSILSSEAENLTSVSATMGNGNQNHPRSDMQRNVSVYQHKIPPSNLHSVTKKSIEQDRRFHPACNSELGPKLDKSTTKHQIPDRHKASPSQSLIATKRKLEEKIDCVEPNNKAKVMQIQLQSTSKVLASNVHKASLSKPQSVTRRQSAQEMKLHVPKKANVMLSKLQSCSQKHKVLDETKASLSNMQFLGKQQMRPGKELHRKNKEKVISTQAKSLIRRPVHEPCYNNDQVDMFYISSLCQNLFRRNHTKHRDDDHDFSDDCMVSSFHDIQKEERKSAKIARKEDDIELLRIEQEESEKRLRRKATTQKLQQK